VKRAKTDYCLTDAQLKKLRAAGTVELRVVVVACRERFGCLRQMQVYRVQQARRREEAQRAAHERQQQLAAAIKRQKVDWSDWPNDVEVGIKG
jgi:hypothetical protein